MKKILLLLPLVLVIAFFGCNKTKTEPTAAIYGKWIIKGTDGSGSAGTLNFYQAGTRNMLMFNCAGSPRATWPDTANVPYKFENGKLNYLNYTDTTRGYNIVNSFKWITEGREFEATRADFLVFISVVDTVRYVKVN